MKKYFVAYFHFRDYAGKIITAGYFYDAMHGPNGKWVCTKTGTDIQSEHLEMTAHNPAAVSMERAELILREKGLLF